MRKRQFMAVLAAAAAAPAAAQVRRSAAASGPALLTITGSIGKSNRPPFDPALDVLMARHKIAFAAAYAFDWGALAGLPARTIAPTLEYDAKRHALRGPLLVDVLRAAGAPLSGAIGLALRAIDGYAPTLALAEARAYGFIVATHRDGEPLALGGLGPLWAVYDADRFPDSAAKPLEQRFANCPWGLYHIEVRPA